MVMRPLLHYSLSLLSRLENKRISVTEVLSQVVTILHHDKWNQFNAPDSSDFLVWYWAYYNLNSIYDIFKDLSADEKSIISYKTFHIKSNSHSNIDEKYLQLPVITISWSRTYA